MGLTVLVVRFAEPSPPILPRPESVLPPPPTTPNTPGATALVSTRSSGAPLVVGQYGSSFRQGRLDGGCLWVRGWKKRDWSFFSMPLTAGQHRRPLLIPVLALAVVSKSGGEGNGDARAGLRLGSAPPDRTPCPSRISAIKQSIRKYAEEPTEVVIRPEFGLSFASLREAYDFYNLYSWEIGFGIRPEDVAGPSDAGGSRLQQDHVAAQRLKEQQQIWKQMSDVEQQMKLDLEHARSHRIIRTRGGTSGNGDVGDSDDPAGEERHQRVCSLAAAALEVVNRTIDNLELFKGCVVVSDIFEHARGLLTALGVDGDIRDQNGEVAEGTDSDEEDDFDWAAGESSRSDWGEKYPASVGLYHVEPSEHDISKFYVGMDLKDELTPGGELTLNLWTCIQRMLSEKDKIMYKGWLDRFRGIFDPRFVFMFPVNFMDCWSVYILEKDKKIVMVLDPTETYPEDEIKIKHEPLAKKFQKRFCNLFNDVYGAGLVETTGSSFVYPLEAQHEPCSRSVHLHHCLSGSSGQIEQLRKKIEYEVVITRGNKRELLDFMCEEIAD
uniref:Uncharacterized protein n=1 Tax=Aegilops tauschii TaxID=37682 RepID=M8C4C4_AEGTA